MTNCLTRREAIRARLHIMHTEMCPHTDDHRRHRHGGPVKPKRYCDECITDLVVALTDHESIPLAEARILAGG